MAIVQVNGSGVTATSTNNKTGRFKGALDSSIASNLLNGLAAARGSDIIGQSFATGVAGGIVKSVSAGVLAYQAKTKYVIRRVSTTIGGVANTILLSGAANKLKRSIHKVGATIKSWRVTTAIRAGYYDIYSGTFTTPPTNGTDTIATDDAANPTRAIPGELTYKYAKPLPQMADYAAKTNG